MINRVTIFVMDSVGIGALPDSEKFGDIGVNTLGNIAKATGGLNLPNLVKLGLGNIDGLEGLERAHGICIYFCRLRVHDLHKELQH